ncbi:Retrovirus-related Pol polyprotein from transposon gypsy [Lucilia cuprina]|uniref:Retrovirus-related Pol polyprotein from transposon gypsy n=1 Tax=Lucilia cuprina TaxID=7375 RepID=A0A0L0BS97_LUCCU|nr:Retrovirus-related Pol polyprotein from transposon gypsy [Lucilia cuprina]
MSKRDSAKIPVTFDDRALEAFRKINNSLSSEQVMLSFPNFEKEFHLTTDASNYALGAVLEQDGKPITFISRTLNKAEEHYATNEKEILAIVWALKTLRNYLYGPVAVKNLTDHQPLTYALGNKNTNSKLKRWKAILEEYNFKIKYKPDSSNIVADAFLNVFKNQIVISKGDAPSYNFEIIFPTYHRHTIIPTEFDSDKLLKILKSYLNPSVTNAIMTEDQILGKIQELWSSYFSKFRTKYTRTMIKDLTSDIEQETEIINEHRRTHRNSKENKLNYLTKHAKIKKIELLTSFGTPENVVIDNEKSLNSASITFMLENQLGIKIYKTPPYTSTVNGQIERFHSTLTEIMRLMIRLGRTEVQILDYSNAQTVTIETGTTKLSLYDLIANLRPRRLSRSIDALGSLWKWVAGTPDHEDFKTVTDLMDRFIENNDKQIVINRAIDTRIQERKRFVLCKDSVFEIKTPCKIFKNDNLENITKSNCLPKLLHGMPSQCPSSNHQHLPSVKEISPGLILLNGYNGTIRAENRKIKLQGTYVTKFHNATIIIDEKSYFNKEV